MKKVSSLAGLILFFSLPAFSQEKLFPAIIALSYETGFENDSSEMSRYGLFSEVERNELLYLVVIQVNDSLYRIEANYKNGKMLKFESGGKQIRMEWNKINETKVDSSGQLDWTRASGNYPFILSWKVRDSIWTHPVAESYRSKLAYIYVNTRIGKTFIDNISLTSLYVNGNFKVNKTIMRLGIHYADHLELFGGGRLGNYRDRFLLYGRNFSNGPVAVIACGGISYVSYDKYRHIYSGSPGSWIGDREKIKFNKVGFPVGFNFDLMPRKGFGISFDAHVTIVHHGYTTTSFGLSLRFGRMASANKN